MRLKELSPKCLLFARATRSSEHSQGYGLVEGALALCHVLSCLAARGGRLHSPDDARAEPREADVRAALQLL